MRCPLFLGKHILKDEHTNWLYKLLHFLIVVLGSVSTQGPSPALRYRDALAPEASCDSEHRTMQGGDMGHRYFVPRSGLSLPDQHSHYQKEEGCLLSPPLSACTAQYKIIIPCYTNSTFSKKRLSH